MPKIVILGSCRYEPYIILLVPNKLDKKMYDKDHEKAYENACKVFYPAIEKADEIWIYAPEGIEQLGEHTKRDLKFAITKKKKIFIVERDTQEEIYLIKEILIERYGRNCLNEAIINGKKKDWFDICKINDENFIILNPKYYIGKENE